MPQVDLMTVAEIEVAIIIFNARLEHLQTRYLLERDNDEEKILERNITAHQRNIASLETELATRTK